MKSNDPTTPVATTCDGDALRIPTLSELATLSAQLSEYVYQQEVLQLAQHLYGTRAVHVEVRTEEVFDFNRQERRIVPNGLEAYDEEYAFLEHFEYTTSWWTGPIVDETRSLLNQAQLDMLDRLQHQQKSPVTHLELLDVLVERQSKPHPRGFVPPFMFRNIERRRVAKGWIDTMDFYQSTLSLRSHHAMFHMKNVGGTPTPPTFPPTIYVPATWSAQ